MNTYYHTHIQFAEHGPSSKCPKGPGCMICAELDCPHAEPLHYHHDGCPSCKQCFLGIEGEEV